MEMIWYVGFLTKSMKKIVASFILVFAAASSLLAQDDTFNKYDRQGQLSKDSVNVEVMVIPTNPELYNSFFDREMMEVNKVSFYTLRDTILMTLSQKVTQAIEDTLTCAVLPESQTGYTEDMAFVYESISYSYELVPQPAEEVTTLNKWKKKFKNSDEPEEPKKGTYMQDGQIVTQQDNQPRFTNINITNPDFLYVLNKKYHANQFVFINKFEMEISTNITQIDIQSDNYPREIRVHYTIVDEKGKEVTSGLIIRNSSSYDNQLSYLFDQNLTQIGIEIARELVQH